MILLGDSREDLRVFTGETANAKAKSTEKFLSPDQNWPNFGGFRGLEVRWYKEFRFLLPKGTSLSESESFKPFYVMSG